MKIYRTYEFDSFYKKLPKDVQNRVNKQLALLLDNPGHPSLRFHKMKGRNLWEISISTNYRIIFKIQGDVYILRRVGTHDILG